MLQEWTRYVDDLGPAKVLLTHDPLTGTRGILVVDNVAAGPAIGGIRMAPDVTVEEVYRLARAMSFKNASAGLPHGGGKAAILADPGMPPLEKERAVRAFARAIAGITDYIPGPDMGTDEVAMAWVRDEIGRAVGELSSSRVVIQGFGAVGRHAARFLAAKGARIVAVADSRGGLFNGDGLPVDALIAHKVAGRPVGSFAGGQAIDNEQLIGLDCEIWIPAARPDVLDGSNCEQLKAKLVLSGANIPATAEAESKLHERGVIVVPDFIANAGGVICASVEYHGGTEVQALAAIEEKVATNTRAVLERAREEGLRPRLAAESIAGERVREAMTYRRAGLPAREAPVPALDM